MRYVTFLCSVGREICFVMCHMTISFLEKPFESLKPCTSISTAFKQKGIY